MSPFSLPWCTPYVNVKLSGACAELKITYQLFGLSIRNPIRKVRIAEHLYYSTFLSRYTVIAIDDIVAFGERILRCTTRIPISPGEACFAVHDFVGGSIFMHTCYFAMSRQVLPLCFTAAPQCQHSTSLLFSNFASPKHNPKCTHIADCSPFSGLSSFKIPISATEATVAAFQPLPVILTWHQLPRREPKHSKTLLA